MFTARESAYLPEVKRTLLCCYNEPAEKQPIPPSRHLKHLLCQQIDRKVQRNHQKRMAFILVLLLRVRVWTSVYSSQFALEIFEIAE